MALTVVAVIWFSGRLTFKPVERLRAELADRGGGNIAPVAGADPASAIAPVAAIVDSLSTTFEKVLVFGLRQRRATIGDAVIKSGRYHWSLLPNLGSKGARRRHPAPLQSARNPSFLFKGRWYSSARKPCADGFAPSLKAELNLLQLKYADEKILRRGLMDTAYRERLEASRSRWRAVAPCFDKKPVPVSATRLRRRRPCRRKAAQSP